MCAKILKNINLQNPKQGSDNACYTVKCIDGSGQSTLLIIIVDRLSEIIAPSGSSWFVFDGTDWILKNI